MHASGLSFPTLQLEDFHRSNTIRSRFSELDALQRHGRVHPAGANRTKFMSFQISLSGAVDILKSSKHSLTPCQLTIIV